jgi:hypothetical protein
LPPRASNLPDTQSPPGCCSEIDLPSLNRVSDTSAEIENPAYGESPAA